MAKYNINTGFLDAGFHQNVIIVKLTTIFYMVCGGIFIKECAPLWVNILWYAIIALDIIQAIINRNKITTGGII